MAVQIGPYSNEYFQSLPNLTYARDMFQNVDGNELVKTTFKDLFVQHKMDRVFGLTLLHRHFDIPVDQLLVEYNGTSTPWNTDAGNGMEKPQPLIWGFDSNGHLTPTEFKYSNRQDNEMGQDELSFVAIFRELLQKKNLTKLFGLCIYPGDDFKGTCEITMNRANINLQPDDVSCVSTELASFTNVSPI